MRICTLEHSDPFDFETSAYKAAKYQHTVAILPRDHYHQGIEIGCSIGVLTSRLAEKCDQLLGIDISERALDRARARCAELPGVKFVRMAVPDEFPDQDFDLMVVSQVAYYWSIEDFTRAKDRIADHHMAGGHLLLVHWLQLSTITSRPEMWCTKPGSRTRVGAWSMAIGVSNTASTCLNGCLRDLRDL